MSIAQRVKNYLKESIPFKTIIIGGILLGCSVFESNAQVYKDQDGDGLIEISYIEDLDNIRNNLTGTCSISTCDGYELTRSLDFKSASSYRSGSINTSYTTGDGWNPIGTYPYAFNATFAGNGFTIDHLYISRTSSDNNNIGLFGYTLSNSHIRNIGITNVSVSGSASVGALAGSNYGSIYQSYATGNVTGSGREVGGLAGNNSGTIIQSYATVSVSGDNFVGGLVGWSDGTIWQSYATGNVIGSSWDVGGLVGMNRASIHQSYATGSVTGSSANVGGLVGCNSYKITIWQCYATGSVSGSVNVGGLVGWNWAGKITQTYATGNVTGSKSVGALVGRNNGNITYSFWNTDANKIGVGYTLDGGTDTSEGLTLSNMSVECSDYYTGICQLDSDFIFSNGNLPKLKDPE